MAAKTDYVIEFDCGVPPKKDWLRSGNPESKEVITTLKEAKRIAKQEAGRDGLNYRVVQRTFTNKVVAKY